VFRKGFHIPPRIASADHACEIGEHRKTVKVIVFNIELNAVNPFFIASECRNGQFLSKCNGRKSDRKFQCKHAIQVSFGFKHSFEKAALGKAYQFRAFNVHAVQNISAQRFAQRGENADDLFQVGCIGLMKAIDNFDTSQNVRFSTYAVPMIIGEIRRYLRDNNAIRVSRSMRDTAYKALQARDRLQARLNREPTMAEIAAEMQIPQEDVIFALEAIQDPVSLFEPVYNDGGDALYIMDQVRDEGAKDDNWVEDIAIRDAMRKLGDREKRIMQLRFFEGRTQMEVAGEIGISQAQVSRLEKQALLHMRRSMQVT